MEDRNLILRILSSIVIFLIYVGALYFNGFIFYLLILALAVVSSIELFNIVGLKKELYILSLILIIIPYSSLLYLNSLQYNKIILAWLTLSIWGTDVFAYFFGKYIGGWKILTVVSPNKTWSGLLAGVVVSIIVNIIMSIIFGIFSVSNAMVIGVLVAIIAQVGDFFESAVKRYYGVKDSGFIIPGHGGVLDRMDGFIFTTPMAAYYISTISKLFN